MAVSAEQDIAAGAPHPATSRRWRGRSPSARARILGWYVVLLAVALGTALLIQRTFLLSQVTYQVDEALDQEVAELRRLAGGVDPETGEPFAGDVAAIFDVFLSRNVALADEGILTFVDGAIHGADLTGARLASTDLVTDWAAVTTSVRDQAETDEGPIRYLAVPLQFDSETRGVFVVAVFLESRLANVSEVVTLGAAVLGSVFLVASALAWAAAGVVLRPVRQVTETARAITDSDLSRRIPVEGNDEIAELGRTFNSMLDRLESAFAAQRRFVDDAGHELRTPITIIRGQLELMGDDPAERRETMALVSDELDRMSRVVDDLLVLARAEQPDFLAPAPLDLGELTRELAVKAEALDGRSWQVDRVEEAVVVADRQRLVQAVMNLARNAGEHSPPGTEVALGSDSDGVVARIWVRDEGPGIPEDELDRLFDRFSRGRTGRRSTAGAGLGLAISQAIAEAHGGRIQVVSTPGAGSRFTFEFPVSGAEGP